MDRKKEHIPRRAGKEPTSDVDVSVNNTTGSDNKNTANKKESTQAKESVVSGQLGQEKGQAKGSVLGQKRPASSVSKEKNVVQTVTVAKRAKKSATFGSAENVDPNVSHTGGHEKAGSAAQPLENITFSSGSSQSAAKPSVLGKAKRGDTPKKPLQSATATAAVKAPQPKVDKSESGKSVSVRRQSFNQEKANAVVEERNEKAEKSKEAYNQADLAVKEARAACTQLRESSFYKDISRLASLIADNRGSVKWHNASIKSARVLSVAVQFDQAKERIQDGINSAVETGVVSRSFHRALSKLLVVKVVELLNGHAIVGHSDAIRDLLYKEEKQFLDAFEVAKTTRDCAEDKVLAHDDKVRRASFSKDAIPLTPTKKPPVTAGSAAGTAVPGSTAGSAAGRVKQSASSSAGAAKSLKGVTKKLF